MLNSARNRERERENVQFPLIVILGAYIRSIVRLHCLHFRKKSALLAIVIRWKDSMFKQRNYNQLPTEYILNVVNNVVDAVELIIWFTGINWCCCLTSSRTRAHLVSLSLSFSLLLTQPHLDNDLTEALNFLFSITWFCNGAQMRLKFHCVDDYSWRHQDVVWLQHLFDYDNDSRFIQLNVSNY